eukprot:7763-Alexandrium_andersonii.AAC.1
MAHGTATRMSRMPPGQTLAQEPYHRHVCNSRTLATGTCVIRHQPKASALQSVRSISHGVAQRVGSDKAQS